MRARAFKVVQNVNGKAAEASIVAGDSAQPFWIPPEPCSAITAGCRTWPLGDGTKLWIVIGLSSLLNVVRPSSTPLPNSPKKLTCYRCPSWPESPDESTRAAFEQVVFWFVHDTTSATRLAVSLGPTLCSETEIAFALELDAEFRQPFGYRKQDHLGQFATVDRLRKQMNRRGEVYIDLPSERPRVGVLDH